MADRAASVSSLRASTGPVLKIKVTDFTFDPEIRTRRSITSDNFNSSGTCVPCTVFETAGGIIQGTGYVDPSDTITALILNGPGVPSVASDYDLGTVQLVLDIVADSAAARFGYAFGGTVGNAKVFLSHLSGKTDEGGMLEMGFEIHSQLGVTWNTNLT